MSNDLLNLVNTADFTKLFINKLHWNQPTRSPVALTVDQVEYTLTEVAEYRGLGVWHCPVIPNSATKRAIDKAVASETIERLIIYTDDTTQEWCWPRINKYRHSGAPTLVAHHHTVGEPNPDLVDRLVRISIEVGTQPTVVDVLNTMREAFDHEAETASVQAARLMGTLYEYLADAEMAEDDASLFLARVLFLMFGDDTEMWGINKRDLFLTWLTEQPADDPGALSQSFADLFDIADTPREKRPPKLDSSLDAIPYINGGIFESEITIPPLGSEFRSAVLDACGFDWGRISPAVFGSMFQTVKSKEARGQLGEFYTTETNILRTIEPLFLNELRDRLKAVWDDIDGLRTLHDDLARMRFMDPACGCGNFLIVTYRELRALELELLKRRDELALAATVGSGEYQRRKSAKPGIAQMSFDPTIDLHVTLDQFYGIEIEAWPAKIAETAMFLVDHLANKAMKDELGDPPNRLPIEISPHIHNTNALAADWAEFLVPNQDVFIFGNPPFLGQYNKTAAQTELTKTVWADDYNGYLDFVTCWHKKTIDYFRDVPGRWAFVSTNSVSQGEACAALWRPILRDGWRCRFAHRSFQWTSEDPNHAHVHVSIIGFDRAAAPEPALWTYLEGGKGQPHHHAVDHINPYLIDYSKDTLVHPSTSPIARQMIPVTKGNQPTDGGNLLVSPAQYDEVAADLVAQKYLRRFVGASELVNNRSRWCLWLVDAPVDDIRASRTLKDRIDRVRDMRTGSSKAATVRKAATPHLFDEIRQPDTAYLAIPRHGAEMRRYFPAASYGPDVICGDANFMAPDPTGLLLAVLSSTMFITWQKAIGGRIKSDIRFSNTFSYNTFPLPALAQDQREALAGAGQGVVAARELYPGKALAQLYDPAAMPPELLAAHQAVDAVLDPAFGIDESASLRERQARLFECYEELIASR
jgi:hypothetical protein